MAIITAAAIGTLIYSTVKEAVLDEITKEEKPDYEGLIKKLDQKLDKIILTLDSIQKKQYQREVQDRFNEFNEVAHRIIDQVKKLPKNEPYEEEDKISYSLLANNIERGESILTDLKFRLLGGIRDLPSIPEHKSLPHIYRDYLINHKHGGEGVPIWDFVGSSYMLMRCGLEAIVGMKVLYTSACRVGGRKVKGDTIKEIEDVAQRLIHVVLSGRARTFEMHYNIYKIGQEIKCNLQQVASGKALDGVDNKSTMNAFEAYIPATNSICPIPSLGGDAIYNAPIYLVGPPDANNVHMTWYLVPTKDRKNVMVRHHLGQNISPRYLGYYEYTIMWGGSTPQFCPPGNLHNLGNRFVLGAEDVRNLELRKIVGQAIWELRLTHDDFVVQLQNVANQGKVIDGDANISPNDVHWNSPQLHVNHPPDMHNAHRQWRVCIIWE